jgi:hypothetical protein
MFAAVQQPVSAPASNESRVCECCGDCYTPRNRRGRPSRYCSAYCRGRKRYACHPRVCSQCGVTFTGSHAERYCSPSCKGLSRTRSCARCGSVFERKRDGQAYCSLRCAAALASPNRNVGRIASRRCKHCGVEFKPKLSVNGTFCSRACSFRFMAARKAVRLAAKEWVHWYYATCRICGQRFKKAQQKQSVCQSTACQEQKRRQDNERNAQVLRERAQLEHEAKATERQCPECRYLFVPAYGTHRRRFCSLQCCARHYRRIARSRRRARVRRTQVEAVNPILVFERDEWRCYLCGVKTPSRLRGTLQPTAPELDHIVPLARNGPHTYQNVACACRKCNIEKGDAIVGQVRIF